MQDTKKIIRQLKSALPGVKERLAGVAVLLLFSAAMLTSASFAWLTLSRAPEVQKMATTIAANGNLEIALSDTDGLEPDISAVGDSSASGKAVMDANLTWGNLVNLTDGYGLNQMTLRPAILNEDGLAEGSPLWGATYDADGRITRLNKDFSFANWVPPLGVVPGQFKVSDITQYGVRAIASVTYSTEGGDAIFADMCDTAEINNGQAQTAYKALITNQTYLNSLAGLLGEYLTGNLNDKTADQIDMTDYVGSLYEMMAKFGGAYDLEAIALADIINIYQYIKNAGDVYAYTPYTAEKLLDKTTTEAQILADTGWTATEYAPIRQFRSDYNQFTSDLARMKELSTASSVSWEQISEMINRLVHINSTTVDGHPVSTIGKQVALDILNSGKNPHEAIITKGFIRNFEELTGGRMGTQSSKPKITVKVTYLIPINLTSTVCTDLYDDSINQVDAYIEAAKLKYGNTPVKSDMVAEDTFGLALDFWVRTNAPDSILTLEGKLVTETHDEDVTVIIDGTTYTVYTAKADMTEGEVTEEVTLDAIKDGNTWYYIVSGRKIQEITPKEEPIKQVEQVTTVIGAEGENRVWQENIDLTSDSTTQGGGSFYVYYANTPEDGMQSLQLLKNIKVAFISSTNDLLAVATMQTEEGQYYSVNGKYYVPLVITQGGTSYTQMGENRTGIMNLTQNQATRITAVLYLDGENLTNDQVLAASNIEGTLNLQFGSDSTLDNADDDKLLTAVRSASATADPVAFSYDTDHDPDNGKHMTTNVKISVAGEQPSVVTARFQRVISATQGARLEEILFTDADKDGTWDGTYTFTSPGKYRLRSVTLDGVEIDIPTPVEVDVAGFTVQQVLMDTKSVMTADRSVARDVEVTFASSDASKMPKTVEARFTHSAGNNNSVTLRYDAGSGSWKGTAHFGTSGTYTLEFLVLDGEYFEVPANMQKILQLSLGMQTHVTVVRKGEKIEEQLKDTDGNPVFDDSGNPVMVLRDPSLEFKFITNQEEFDFTATITDDQDVPQEGLTGVQLYYLWSGSSLVQDGINAPMTWNYETKQYEGTGLLTKAGTYNFSNIRVDGNNITYATGAPRINAISPEPPSYVAGSAKIVTANEGDTYVFSPDGNAMAQAQIKYSGADMKAYFQKNGSTEEFVSVGQSMQDTVDNVTTWQFPVPKTGTSTQTQDGQWKLVRIEAGGVYDSDGNYYEFPTEEKPDAVPMSLAVDDCTEVKIVQTVNVNFVNAADITINNNFLEAKTLQAGAFTVSISDYTGAALPIVEGSVKMVLQHNRNTTSTYGNYTNNLSGVSNIERFTVAANANGTTSYTTAAVEGMKLAGEYAIDELTFTIGTKGYTYKANPTAANETKLPIVGHIVKIYSEQPVVTITGINPAQGTNKRYFTSTNPTSTGQLVTEDRNRIVGQYTAAVYLYVEPQSGWRDQEVADVKEPTVTLSVTGMPADFSTVSTNGASMAFNNASNNTVSTFSFDRSSLKATGSIGAATDGTLNWAGTSLETYPILYPAGKQSVDTFTVQYNGYTYGVTLDNAITINQPINPPKVVYANITDYNSSYTGGSLSGAQSQNGDTTTLTLATVPAWTENKSQSSGGTPSVGTPTTRAVYRTWSEWSWSSFKNITYYQAYTETVSVSRTSTMLTSWVATHEITGWRIGSTVYKPGDTVTITGDQTIIPIITTTDGPKTQETKTEVVTTTTYTKNGGQTTTKPSGTNINTGSSEPENSTVTTYE